MNGVVLIGLLSWLAISMIIHGDSLNPEFKISQLQNI